MNDLVKALRDMAAIMDNANSWAAPWPVTVAVKLKEAADEIERLQDVMMKSYQHWETLRKELAEAIRKRLGGDDYPSDPELADEIAEMVTACKKRVLKEDQNE